MKRINSILTFSSNLLANFSFVNIILLTNSDRCLSQQIRSTDHESNPIHFACQKRVDLEFEKLANSDQFKISFEKEYSISFTSFSELNELELLTIKKVVSNKVCSMDLPLFEIRNELIVTIKKFKENFLFAPLIQDAKGITRLGKHTYIPHEVDSVMWGVPKILLCTNADFEEGTFNSWQTFCAQVNNQIAQTINVTPYTPPTNCPQPIGGAPQHVIVTGGIDPFSGFPRVFPGGTASARLGDFIGVNAKASVMRKTFIVDTSNTLLRYSYMAVLENPDNHLPGEQPFFRARLYDQYGVSDTCASYDSYGGDGKTGWIAVGEIQYRDWTTIFIPLDNYIGQTVTLELATGDCSLTGHFGYAFVDVSCGNLEIERECVGVSTVLNAPSTSGTFLWNTGETTDQITITTPGLYVCTVTPFGSPCSVDISYYAELFPIPVVDFIPSSTNPCVGDNVVFTDNTDHSSGSIISSYLWDFGDGISSPPSMGQIIGVPQTTGTYILADHFYTNSGALNVTLSAETADGCIATASESIVINALPTAVISGSTEVCLNEPSPTITITGSNGNAPYTFTYNINGGVNQTSISVGSTATLIVPTNIEGIITYNLTYVEELNGACGQLQNGVVTVIVNPLPTAQITGTTAVCINNPSPAVIFSAASGNSGYTFSYNINGGSNQTISTTSSSVSISVPTTAVGSFSYNLLSVVDNVTLCSQTQIQSAIITVYPIPIALISGSDTVCLNEPSPTIAFTGASGVAPYVFTYSLNGGANQTIVSSGNVATIAVPTNLSGTLVYELSYVDDVNGLCGQPQTGSATVVINPLPTAQITSSATICLGDVEPTITFSSPNGSNSCVFTYNINGGANQTIATSGLSSVSLLAPTGIAGTFSYNLLSVTDLATMCSQAQNQSVTIVVNPIPSAYTEGSRTVCQNDTQPQVIITGINALPDYTFSYNINNGLAQIITTSGSSDFIINVPTNVPGTYTYNLTNVTTFCSQDLNLSETIIVNPLPVATISNPIEMCVFEDSLIYVIFTGSIGVSPYTFTYNLNGGMAQQISTPPGVDSIAILIPSNISGIYNYTITNIQEGSVLACNQNQYLVSNVTIHPQPTVYAGPDLTICDTLEVILQGSGSMNIVDFFWCCGIINGLAFVPNDTSLYTLIGTDIYGCSDTDQVVVNVAPYPIIDFEGINLAGCSPLTATFVNLTQGNLLSSIWNFPDGVSYANMDTIAMIFYNEGYYDVSLTATNFSGCTATLTLYDYLNVFPYPEAAFDVNPNELTTYDWEATMTNFSQRAVSYVWDFGDGSVNSNEINPVHSFPNDVGGVYLIELVAYSNQGCTDTAYHSITLTDEFLFYVPNTFTPDQDQFNEIFKPVFSTGFNPSTYTLLIFNRWGEVVFESHDINYGWNGHYKGNRSQDGTFTWKIQINTKSDNKRKELVGHVNIIK